MENLSSHNNDKRRILFVDDDRNVLDGIRRLLRCRKNEWKIEFVTRGTQALKVMKDTHYDIIVSDLKMPVMDGVELLEKVRKRFPGVIRFMLTGYSDQPLKGKALRCSHKLLTKPCNAQQLSKLIENAFRLDEKIKSEKVSNLISKMQSLPVMPKNYQRVIDILAQPDCSPRDVGRMIEKDIGMSAKIMQVANSSFYSGGGMICDPVRAVVHLGLHTVEALILSAGIFSRISEKTAHRFWVDGLQEHAARVGMLARDICESWHLEEETVELAGMAGILHDAGKMVLISGFADETYEMIIRSRYEKVCYNRLEEKLLGATHAEIGANILELWGLPHKIVEAVVYHHDQDNLYEGKHDITAAVYIANQIDNFVCMSPGDGYEKPLNLEVLYSLGLENVIKNALFKRFSIDTEELHNVIGCEC